jgi:hypothetical protein
MQSRSAPKRPQRCERPRPEVTGAVAVRFLCSPASRGSRRAPRGQWEPVGPSGSDRPDRSLPPYSYEPGALTQPQTAPIAGRVPTSKRSPERSERLARGPAAPTMGEGNSTRLDQGGELPAAVALREYTGSTNAGAETWPARTWNDCRDRRAAGPACERPPRSNLARLPGGGFVPPPVALGLRAVPLLHSRELRRLAEQAACPPLLRPPALVIRHCGPPPEARVRLRASRIGRCMMRSSHCAA